MTTSEAAAGEASSADTADRVLTMADYEPPQAGAVTNLVCGAVVSLLGLGALLVAWDLGFGSMAAPGAGTWPAILSALLLVLGIFIMLRAKTYEDAEKLTRNAAAVAVGVVSLVVAVQLMPLVGFELPATAMMIFWMSVLGKERFRLSVPLSVVMVVAFYLVFITGLNVPIPRLF
ncbi:tripartite tricarboxylate transporter TctB family protein [Nesterenkonia flava]|uniref:Tripartite tricarboxylate transporter TctB family protein n=1 Tax=Nesterenkonia flava TaxID=469799 RepID=A0ABU1FU91_9MICC|nr:tripartite tricarboxylate transporter TctB family protein [Nesterenkonia flava]MDR5711753.1 tripartite tricarboxylate transporter TctB family protein [Nesterenkonia flava]